MPDRPATIRFEQPYPGGRILLMCGQVQAGAVFPPAGTPHDRRPWVWRLWIGGQASTLEGRATTEDKAKGALLAALIEFLARASLQPIGATHA